MRQMHNPILVSFSRLFRLPQVSFSASAYRVFVGFSLCMSAFQCFGLLVNFGAHTGVVMAVYRPLSIWLIVLLINAMHHCCRMQCGLSQIYCHRYTCICIMYMQLLVLHLVTVDATIHRTCWFVRIFFFNCTKIKYCFTIKSIVLFNLLN